MASKETPVYAGDRFKVQQGDRGWFVATIKDRRPLRKVLKAMKGKKSSEQLDPTDYEYYVHYDHFDSRCDEWVDLDRIDSRIAYSPMSQDDDSEETGRKKRKSVNSLRYDERKLDVISGSRRGSGIGREGGSRSTKVARRGGLSERGSRVPSSSSSSAMSSEVDGNHQGADSIKGDPENTKQSRNEKVNEISAITSCILGKHEMKTWYKSNYPEDRFQSSGTLFLCEFCLEHKHNHTTLFGKHKCAFKCPPGGLIYRDDELKLGVWEIDGRVHKAYCQNLCSMSKLFLEDKSIFNSTDNFYFYVLCEFDDAGAHIVGYFSKEKASPQNYNVACILVLPPYLSKGYGKFLISLSYELSKIDGNDRATPERPLSDLGEKAYLKFWCQRILRSYFDEKGRRRREGLTMREICRQTGIRMEDVAAAMDYMVKRSYGVDAEGRTLRSAQAKTRLSVMCFHDFAMKSFVDKVGTRTGFAKPDCIVYQPKRI